MSYIQIDKFGGNINIVCKNDDSGEPLLFDTIQEAGEMFKMIYQASLLNLQDTDVLEEQLIGMDVCLFWSINYGTKEC